MQNTRDQELIKKILAACLNCRHLKQMRGGRLRCEVSIGRCPKKRAKEWMKQVNDLQKGADEL